MIRFRNSQSKIRYSFWLWFLLSTVLMTGAAEIDSSFAGVYRDEQIVVELNAPVRTAGVTSYTGTIQVGLQKYPLKAEADDTRLKGTFESQGDRFEFSGLFVGRMLVLTTDGTTYRLKKQALNPLSSASKTNPLSRPRTNAASAPAVASPVTTNSVPPAPSTTTASTPAVENPRRSPLRLQHYSVMDDVSMIGGEAFSVLAPPQWKMEGGVAWRMYPSAPACVTLRLSNATHTESWEVFPTLAFVWNDEGIPEFQPGSVYLGNEVAQPIDDPAAYIKRVILPRFRKDVPQPKVTATEQLPALASAVAVDTQEQAVEKKFRASRVRIEYLEHGSMMEEDIFCVLSIAYAPLIKTALWGPERNYAFKAEKGKLDERRPIFQVMVSSFKPNLQWFNRYAQLVQFLLQNQPDTTRPVSDLSAYAARTTDDVTEPRRQAFLRQEATRERVNLACAQDIPGLEEFRNPLDNRPVLLPASYRDVWVNQQGEFVLCDDANFNPNSGVATGWLRVSRER
jgi:hypothetical protein